MKGLLIKEKYLMWQVCKTLLIVPLLYLATVLVSVLFDHDLDMIPMGMVYLFMGIIPISTCNIEMASRWHTYCVTLPYSRSTLVSSKYVASLIIVALTTVLCTASLYIGILCGGELSMAAVIKMMFMGIGVCLLPATAFFPLHFGFYSMTGGGRIFFSGGIGGLVAGMNVVLMDIVDKTSDDPFGIAFIFMAVMMALFLLSWLISIAIFKGKDV